MTTISSPGSTITANGLGNISTSGSLPSTANAMSEAAQIFNGGAKNGATNSGRVTPVGAKKVAAGNRIVDVSG